MEIPSWYWDWAQITHRKGHPIRKRWSNLRSPIPCSSVGDRRAGHGRWTGSASPAPAERCHTLWCPSLWTSRGRLYSWSGEWPAWRPGSSASGDPRWRSGNPCWREEDKHWDGIRSMTWKYSLHYWCFVRESFAYRWILPTNGQWRQCGSLTLPLFFHPVFHGDYCNAFYWKIVYFDPVIHKFVLTDSFCFMKRLQC